MDKIRIALANKGAGTEPVFATVEGGYFREQGLEPELIPYWGHSRSLAALIAGEADFTNAVGPEVIMANRRHRGDAVLDEIRPVRRGLRQRVAERLLDLGPRQAAWP